MTGRYNHHKGSSRSTRDDSRHSERERDRERKRSRSRSPRRRHYSKQSKDQSPERSSSSKERDRREHDKKDYNKSSVEREGNTSSVGWETNEAAELPAPPPPPRISKISIDLPKPKAPIKMNIGGMSSKPTVAPKPTIASVFNADSDDEDEPEEMPAEAKMRMRNIGRDTPTSAGPNSFGKTKQGFCDAKKVFEKNLKQALEMNERPAMPKFPQTIYKIKGP
ncbi:hypothetical protein K1T71_009986 [Dendrolimus kikuchii]|uniref:Uncharacterized protein n=1 Tax=Dendrolimus kikuchii TaxID=765133 RepID=A0ACC1CT85_9NEOP|nr:hypothetical protein K1T71_009986 [Dendrolimus kikuchii]